MTNIAYSCPGRKKKKEVRHVNVRGKKKVTAFLFKMFSCLISPAKNATSSNEKIQVEMSSL